MSGGTLGGGVVFDQSLATKKSIISMNPVRHQLDDRGMGKNPSMGRHCNKGSFWEGIIPENDNCLGRFSCVDFMLYMNSFYHFSLSKIETLKREHLKRLW